MEYKYPHFIPENVAPKGAKRIIVQDKTGKVVAKMPLGSLKPPSPANKLYSFGVLSDVHVTVDETARANFQTALTYLHDVENVDFICIAGDLTQSGSATQYQTYAGYVQEYAKGTPVYEVTGNHDVETFTGTTESVKPYTGEDLYYTFEVGNDLFIMFGMQGWKTTGETFSDASITWLKTTLEANKNRRCFVFEHCPRWDGAGVPYPTPAVTGDILLSSSGYQFKQTMVKYPNAIWFHGHTHMDFMCQEEKSFSNYDRLHTCHSVHIPSLASVKVLNSAGTGYNYLAKGQGYIVDVYPDCIHLRGRDFKNGEFMSIATYCLET